MGDKLLTFVTKLVDCGLPIYIYVYMFICVCICFKSVKTTLSEERMGQMFPFLCYSCTEVTFMQNCSPENYLRPALKLNL